MIKRKGFGITLAIASLIAGTTACSLQADEAEDTQGAEFIPTPTTRPSAPEPTITPSPKPTSAATATNEISGEIRFDSCPITLANSVQWPVEATLEEVNLDFEVNPIEVPSDWLYSYSEGFAMLKESLSGELVVSAYTEDGLNWTTFDNVFDRPPAASFGLSHLEYREIVDRFELRPGLGGEVEIISGEGPYGLCIAKEGEEEAIVRPMPFGGGSDDVSTYLAGVTDELVVLLVDIVDNPEFIIYLDEVELVALEYTFEAPFADRTTGELVNYRRVGERVEFFYVESGQIIQDIDSDEFVKLVDDALAVGAEETIMAIDYLAWSKDEGRSWKMAMLPGQAGETELISQAAVSQDGLVSIQFRTYSSLNVIDRRAFEGPSAEEAGEQEYKDFIAQGVSRGVMRVQLPVDG